jgi:hypothetical protein
MRSTTNNNLVVYGILIAGCLAVAFTRLLYERLS